MKVQIILTDRTVNVEMNEPSIEVTAKPGFSISLIGGVGPQGPEGYRPVKGLDYWTAEDQDAVIAAAVEALLDVYPAAEGVEW